MTDFIQFNWLIPVSLVTGILALVYLVLFFKRLKKMRVFAAFGKLTGFALFALLAAFSGFLVLSVSSYQRLTAEQQVATIRIQPNGKQRFIAEVQFASGVIKQYPLYGDQLQIDAYIVKWKPWLTLLGMETGYRLDRISGRYQQLSPEAARPLAYELSSTNPLDIALWRSQHQILSWAVDVEHGSASWVDATQTGVFHLMVTNDALLLRPDA